MREWHVWAAASAVALVLLAVGVPVEAVLGLVTLISFLVWLGIEFLNIMHWVQRKLARYRGELEPTSVEDSLVKIDRTSGEYAGTRNAKQELRRFDNGG